MAQPTNRRHVLIALWAVVIALVPLLFLGGPDYFSPRSFRCAWQFGHVILFACAGSLLALNAWWQQRGLAVLLCSALLAGLGAGILIEWLQQFAAGRESSASDVRLDVLGALLGAAWFALPSVRREVFARYSILLAVIGIITVLDGVPLLAAVVDEAYARRDFPVLADFETPFQPGRWSAPAALAVMPAPDGRRGHVMAVQLEPAQYAGFALKHFARDWSGYQTLTFEIFRHGNQPMTLSCRINDIAHETDNRFEDRFNRRFDLQTGWTRIEIPLSEVRAAPLDREMNLAEIAALGCFLIDLREPEQLFIDNVRLISGGQT